MKFKLQENEVKRILEMHSNFKKTLLKEDANDDAKFQLEAMVKKGCVPGGVLQEINTKLTSEKWSIKNTSTMNPSKSRYFLNNGEVLEWDGTKLSKLTKKWDVEACRTKEVKQVLTAAEEQEIKRDGWLTADQAIAQGVSFQKGQYDEKSFAGIRYFKKKGVEISGKASTEQEQLSTYLTATYGSRYSIRVDGALDTDKLNAFCWAFPGEQPAVSSPKWKSQKVSAGGAYGTETVEIFRNPMCTQDTRQISRERGTQERQAISLTPDQCAQQVNDYYQDYEDGVDATSDEFRTNKETVKRCKAKFCSKDKVKSGGECDGKWKQGLFGGGNRLNSIIDFFSHKPSSIGQLSRSDAYSLLR